MNNKKIKLNSINEAIEDIKEGKVIIVVDDKSRENEGDFVIAAEKITPNIINFMSKYGRGLICVPLTEDRCDKLELDLMVHKNTESQKTAFTVSVDKIGDGCTTGISAKDRYKTVASLVDENTKPIDLSRPGHIFPIRAKEGGVLRRAGHTEAAIDIASLAGLKPAAVIVEIMKEDGTMARIYDLIDIAKRFNLKIISIEDLIAYRIKNNSLINMKQNFDIDTRFGKFKLFIFEELINKNIHIAITKGNWTKEDKVLVRVSANYLYSNILYFLSKNENNHIEKIFNIVSKEDKAAVIFVNKKDYNVMMNLSIKNKKLNKSFDNKDYGIGAQIIRALNISKLKIITKNNKKKIGLSSYGLEIVDTIKY